MPNASGLMMRWGSGREEKRAGKGKGEMRKGMCVMCSERDLMREERRRGRERKSDEGRFFFFQWHMPREFALFQSFFFAPPFLV
jgi:hypothetical protein